MPLVVHSRDAPACSTSSSTGQLESRGESDATVGSVLTILPSLQNETSTQVSPCAMSRRCGATSPSCCKGIHEAELGLGGSTARRSVRANFVCRSLAQDAHGQYLDIFRGTSGKYPPRCQKGRRPKNRSRMKGGKSVQSFWCAGSLFGLSVRSFLFSGELLLAGRSAAWCSCLFFPLQSSVVWVVSAFLFLGPLQAFQKKGRRPRNRSLPWRLYGQVPPMYDGLRVFDGPVIFLLIHSFIHSFIHTDSATPHRERSTACQVWHMSARNRVPKPSLKHRWFTRNTALLCSPRSSSLRPPVSAAVSSA